MNPIGAAGRQLSRARVAPTSSFVEPIRRERVAQPGREGTNRLASDRPWSLYEARSELWSAEDLISLALVDHKRRPRLVALARDRFDSAERLGSDNAICGKG